MAQWNKFYFNTYANDDYQEPELDYEKDIICNAEEYGTLEEQVTELLNSEITSGNNANIENFVPNDIELKRIRDFEPIVKKVCESGYYKILDRILQNVSISLNYQNPILCIVGRNLQKFTPDQRINYAICFSLLLDYKNINECINTLDYKGNNALYYAVKFKNDEFIMTILKKGGLLGVRNKMNELPIKNINPTVLENYLDSCVLVCDFTPGTREYEVALNYEGFMCSEKASKSIISRHSDIMAIFKFIAESGKLRHLVLHPVINYLTWIKWFDMRSIFFYNVLVCCMLITTGYHLAFNLDLHHTDFLHTVIEFLAYFVLYYLTFREIFQLITSKGFLKSEYLTSLANWSEVLLIIVLFILLYRPKDMSNERVKSLSAISVLLIAFQINLISQTFPFSTIPIYVRMFQRVALNFFKLFLIYGGILVAFTISFHILFKPDVQSRFSVTIDNVTYTDFEHISTSLVKTFTMFAGEFDASDINFEAATVSYIVFIAFIFFVSITLSNLLQGLAVSDIQKIEEDAEFNRVIYRILVMERYENYLNQYPLEFISNLPGYVEKLIIAIGCCFGRRHKLLFKSSTKFNAIKKVLIYPNLKQTKIETFQPTQKEFLVVKNHIQKDIYEMCKAILAKRESDRNEEQNAKRFEKIDEIYQMLSEIKTKLGIGILETPVLDDIL